MLGLILLPIFTYPGHECPDHLSPCDGMHMCKHRLDVGYTLIRESFGGMDSEPMFTPREKSPLPELEVQRRIKPTTHDAASCRTASPTHY